MRFVIDTDVVVAAVRSRKGASAALLAHLIEGDATLLLSVAVALEYETVALLPDHIMAGGSSTSTVGKLIDTLIDISEAVKVSFRYRPQLLDPGDEMVLEAAINGRADAIVTFNRKDYIKDGEFVHWDFGIDVIGPAVALRRIRRRIGQQGIMM
jgi:putative PIN family toxin of toxin-antitoxin system